MAREHGAVEDKGEDKGKGKSEGEDEDKAQNKDKAKRKGEREGQCKGGQEKSSGKWKGKGVQENAKEKTTTATGGGAERNEQEPDLIVVQDPWATLRSAWGGRASPAEEMAVLVEGEGKVIALRREDIESAGGLEGAKVLRSETIERALRQHFRQKTPVGTDVTDGGENTSTKIATDAGHHVCTVVVDKDTGTVPAPEERQAVSRLQVSSCDIESIELSLQLRSELISLNLSDNTIDSDCFSKWVSGYLWLRHLSLWVLPEILPGFVQAGTCAFEIRPSRTMRWQKATAFAPRLLRARSSL